jgi:membrane-associated PAP2 superfamily phosphatase
MSNRRENLLLSGGVLIGFGAGLCVGVGLLFVGVAFLLHHMFVMGIQWTRLLAFTLVPLIAIAAGGLLLWRARRVEV